MARRKLIALSAALVVGACGLDVAGRVEGSGANDGGAPPVDGGPGDLDVAPGDSGGDAAEAGPKLAVYAASDDALWKLDPTTLEFERLASLTGCPGGLEEIAVASDGGMLATRADNGELRRVVVDGGVATCTSIRTSGFPYALTFVPKGTVDPAAEALVGFRADGSYVRVDVETGDVAELSATGIFPYSPNGDIVSAGGKGYVAANGPSCDDCVVEFDLATGALVGTKVGDVGSADTWGLGYSAGKLFAFINGTGRTHVVTLAPFAVAVLEPPDGGGGALHWHGAGSSTLMP